MSMRIPGDWRSYQGALANREQSVLQLTEQCLQQIAEHNERLNAFVHVDTQGALQAAKAADARLHKGERLSVIDGLPIAVKDNIDITGYATAAGIRARDDCMPARDATVVERLRAKGAVVIGKTNLHEAALGATTDNPWFGRTHHPLAPGFTAGGSSGGSACAVAASMAIAALGTDTMGSVRLPASYCGLVGLKPSAGLISIAGVVPLAVQLDTVGPLAHSVADVRDLMSVLVAYDERCAVSQHTPANMNFATHSASVNAHTGDLSTLRFWAPGNLHELGAESHVIEVVNAQIDKLANTGAVIDRAPFEVDLTRLRYAGLLLVEHEAAAFHASMRELRPNGFSKELCALLDYGQRLSKERLDNAQHIVDETRIMMRDIFANYDAMLLPTTLHSAFSFDQAVPANQADLTGFVNLSGCPALSLPCPVSQTLPVGLQVISAMFTDDKLLNIGEAISTVMTMTGRDD